MLHDAQRTSAPSALSVSMSTAVWIVMCNEPVMRAPFNGLSLAYSERMAIKAGISDSAMAISRRPQPASSIFATLKSVKPATGLMLAFILSVLRYLERAPCELHCLFEPGKPGARFAPPARRNAPRTAMLHRNHCGGISVSRSSSGPYALAVGGQRLGTIGLFPG